MAEPDFNGGAKQNGAQQKPGNDADAMTYGPTPRTDNYTGWQKLSTSRWQKLAG